jgi:hypothetical protein
MGAGSSSRGGRESARRGGGQDSGVPDVVDEEQLQLSNFNITDDDDDLFTTNVPLRNDYMNNWLGKFVGVEHHANIAHEKGEEYADNEEW